MTKHEDLLADAVAWIAFNDEDGADWALEVEPVSSMLTVALVSSVFGLSNAQVATLVVGIRRADKERSK